MDDTTDLECIIIGGGAAGLSAALVLGRARRSVLVVDASQQSNRAAHGIGGLLGHNGRPPGELYRDGRAELAAHPTVGVRDGTVLHARPEGRGFVVELANGERATARRLLLATGMEYRYPAIDGVEERWGNSVFHCPFCHGWEVRERPLGVLVTDPAGAHRAGLLRAWSDDVTAFTNGAALDGDVTAALDGAGVQVDDRRIARLVGEGADLGSIEFADGAVRSVGGLLVPVTLHQRGDLAASLGVRFAEPNPVVVEAIEVDGMLRTSVPGVWAAGDASVDMPSIQAAIAQGAKAGAMIVADITVGGH